MICASIGEKSVEGCMRALENVEFAEVRLDRISGIDVEGVKRIFSLSSSGKRLIATCRKEASGGSLEDSFRKELLLAAIDSGAAYVDLELEMEEGMQGEITERAKGKGCRLIISFHDFGGAPERGALGKIVEKCFLLGADIAKIACMVNSQQDNARLLGLLGEWKGLIIIGMGGKGRATRILAPLLGAEFTFASLGEETAPGQIGLGKMEKIMERIGNELETD